MRWLLLLILLLISTAATPARTPNLECRNDSDDGDDETCGVPPTLNISNKADLQSSNNLHLNLWYSTMVPILGSVVTILITLSKLGVMTKLFDFFAKQRNIEDMKRKMKNQRLPLLTTVWDVKYRLWGFLSPKDKRYWQRIAEENDEEAMAYHTTHTTFLIGQLFYDLEQLRTDPFFSVHLNLALPLQKVSMLVNSAFSQHNFAIWPYPVGEKVAFSLGTPRTWQDIITRTPSKVVRVNGWIRCKHCFGINHQRCTCSLDLDQSYYTTKDQRTHSKPLHARVEFTVELDLKSKSKCDQHGIAYIDLYRDHHEKKISKPMKEDDAKPSGCTVLIRDHLEKKRGDRMRACNSLFDDPILCIFKGDQRAMGTQMRTIGVADNGSKKIRCLTYDEFIAKLSEPGDFAQWFDHVRAQLSWLIKDGKCGSLLPRMMTIHNYLVDLVDIVDESGRIATEIWGNSVQVYFDSRGFQESVTSTEVVAEETGEEEEKQSRARSPSLRSRAPVVSNLRSPSSELNLSISGVNGCVNLRCTTNDTEREIIRADIPTQQIRNAFPKPAVLCNKVLMQTLEEALEIH